MFDEDTHPFLREDRGELTGQPLAQVHVSDIDITQAFAALLEHFQGRHVGPRGPFLLVKCGWVSWVFAIPHAQLLTKTDVPDAEVLWKILLHLGSVLRPRFFVDFIRHCLSFHSFSPALDHSG